MKDLIKLLNQMGTPKELAVAFFGMLAWFLIVGCALIFI